MMNAFADLNTQLTALMLRAAPGMKVTARGEGGLSLQSDWCSPIKPGQPMWFGGVRIGKAYVSYHLMPLYTHPALMAQVSPALKKRMQGKSCFNFKTGDPVLFEELEALTGEAARLYGA
jgi:hypothetical protein